MEDSGLESHDRKSDFFMRQDRHVNSFCFFRMMLVHRGYRGTREVGKKKEKRIPWGEALEPARAGRAALKFESGHGPERKIALSISLEKK